MTESNSERATTSWDDDDEPSRDTLALLQEEIARLESELRDRDEAARGLPASESAVECVLERGEFEHAVRRVSELEGELAGREEMVSILLEQSRLFEEAAAAGRAEWEQLSGWLDEVERRVDGRETGEARIRDELESERGRAEALRRSNESDRRSWEARRAGLEREVQLLRAELARGQDRVDSGSEESAFSALACENRKLRQACASMESAAAESEELGVRLASTLVELDEARRELLQVSDSRERERREYESGLAELRSRLARESLRQETGSPAPHAAPAADAIPPNSAMDADERIRAFRQHLSELHENEAAQRADRSLSCRLSRLWRHTGPT